jgi:serine phosphatase RsbU (regulator of sigma subunit)
MSRLVLIFAFITINIRLYGQINEFGIPFIKNYKTQITQGGEQNWCITKDKTGNLYFGNQESGVIRYDGTRWSSITIGNNPRIFSLASDTNGIVYVGAAYEFGYIQPDIKGKPEYISLAKRTDSIPAIGTVFTIAVHEGNVFFQTPRLIYVYNIKEDSISTIRLTDYNLNLAFRLVEINDHLILTDNVAGIFELTDNKITPLPGGEFFKNKICTVLMPYDESQILVGTFYEGLFLYNYKTGIVIDDFIDSQILKKLRNVSVYSGVKLGNDIFAIGTTNTEGLMVFNKSGKIIQQLRVENCDLEDNTMLAMYCDYSSNSELWVSTYGVISKIYFNIPMTKYAEKQGIESGINEICRYRDDFYLSSDAGILKSYINDKNELNFKRLNGINTQVFPLEVIKTPDGEIFLAGSINGILQISENDIIKKVESICNKLPLKQSVSFNAKKIVQSELTPEIIYFGLEVGGVLILRYEGNQWTYINRLKKTPGIVSSIVEREEGGLWILTEDPNKLFRVDFSGNDTVPSLYNVEKGIPDTRIYSIFKNKDNLYITTSSGILRYDKNQDKFLNDNTITGGFSEGKNVYMLFHDDEGDLWFNGTDKRIKDVLFRTGEKTVTAYQGVLNLLPDVPDLDINSYDGKIYLIKSKIVCVIDKSQIKTDSTLVKTFLTSVTTGKDSVVMKGSFHRVTDQGRRIQDIYGVAATVPEYGFNMNAISFEWTTPSFTEELLTEYSCILEGFDDSWSEWEGISYGNTMEALYPRKTYTNLPYGHYKFRVRTKTLTGQQGNEVHYEFIILKPWYATIFAYIAFALIALLIIFIIIKSYTRKLINENLRLEGIVAERTAVVVKQKEELESSIHYASRIQMALLPSQAILSENIKNFFVLFKPRDIVSGDFYWMRRIGERLYIVVADCTGHGVPGAFMSLLGISFLDEIIAKDLAPRADQVLSQLRIHVTESLKQVGDNDEAKDGMDMALLVIDFEKQRVEYSGAYNPCFKVRKLTDDEKRRFCDNSGEMADGSMTDGNYLLETVYPSKMPIGISSRMNEDFVFKDWALEAGYSFYLFSDGYIDQFGGPDGRKFMKKNFKRLILEIQDLPMDKQKETLEKNMMVWIGNSPQIDDILILGIRIE